MRRLQARSGVYPHKRAAQEECTHSDLSSGVRVDGVAVSVVWLVWMGRAVWPRHSVTLHWLVVAARDSCCSHYCHESVVSSAVAAAGQLQY